MKTRTKKPAAHKTSKNNDTTTPKPAAQTLGPNIPNPPQVFILPKNTSPSARILTLPHPATEQATRYFVCPEKGWYEFTRVAAPKRGCRSWLLAPDRAEEVDNEGFVLQTPDLMIATPIDPLFLLLPALAQDAQHGKTAMYLTLSDYLDRLEESSEHFKHVMRSDARGQLEAIAESRVKVVCDVMEAGEETLYRLYNAKLMQELFRKAERMAEGGLPASMEERFVKQVLAVPIISIKREESGVSVVDDELTTTKAGAENIESESSAPTSQDSPTTNTTAASDSTAATALSALQEDSPPTPSEILPLLRLRTSLNFLLSSYIPPALRSALETLPCPIEFSPLDVHLAHINKLKKEAHALRSLSDNISRKRSAMGDNDDDAAEKQEVKKRKKEEEEARRRNVSRGVKQLGKADVSGMKKMSSFFTKAGAKKS